MAINIHSADCKARQAFNMASLGHSLFLPFIFTAWNLYPNVRQVPTRRSNSSIINDRSSIYYWQRAEAIYTSKTHLTPNIMESRSPVTSILVTQLFWNSSQSTAVSLPYSVKNFKMIWRLRNESWTNKRGFIRFEFRLGFGVGVGVLGVGVGGILYMQQSPMLCTKLYI